MMRMVAGFVDPSAGEIMIDGQSVTNLPPNKRPVNMVFQSYAIFPHLTVAENIGFGLRRRQLSTADLDDRVKEALDLINLPDYGDRRAHELSGGERQRVALARALVCAPKALLLDEPLGALDKKLREKMQLELRSLQRQVGITFLFVTHDQEEALAMSNRVCVMNRGRVIEVAEPDALYSRPKSRFTAEFVGTMNMFDCKVTTTGDFLSFEVDGIGEVRSNLPFTGIVGERIAIGIRPESIYISEDGNVPDGAMSARFSVSDLAYLGDRWMIVAKRGDCEIQISASQGDPYRPDVGSEALVYWKPGAVIPLRE